MNRSSGPFGGQGFHVGPIFAGQSGVDARFVNDVLLVALFNHFARLVRTRIDVDGFAGGFSAPRSLRRDDRNRLSAPFATVFFLLLLVLSRGSVGGGGSTRGGRGSSQGSGRIKSQQRDKTIEATIQEYQDSF